MKSITDMGKHFRAHKHDMSNRRLTATRLHFQSLPPFFVPQFNQFRWKKRDEKRGHPPFGLQCVCSPGPLREWGPSRAQRTCPAWTFLGLTCSLPVLPSLEVTR